MCIKVYFFERKTMKNDFNSKQFPDIYPGDKGLKIWDFLKNWFGFTTIGAFFSGNIAIGVVLFVGYLIIGYVIGLITFLLGAVRYIQLRLLFKR